MGGLNLHALPVFNAVIYLYYIQYSVSLSIYPFACITPKKTFSDIKLRHIVENIRKILSHPSNAEATFIESTRMQRFLLFFYWKSSEFSHVGIHLIALTEYSQMNTHVPGFQSFSSFLRHFVLTKLAISSVRVEQVMRPFLGVTGLNGLLSKFGDQYHLHTACMMVPPLFSDTN